MKCPHVTKSELAGDEHGWCVACLRAEVKRLREALRDVAERQREACAEFLSAWIRGKNEHKWTGPGAIRATPLVTDTK